MPRGYKIMLSFSDWPAEDQLRWEAAFKSSDRFDERSYGAHLAPATRKARRESYGRFLGFISTIHPNRLKAPPGSTDRSEHCGGICHLAQRTGRSDVARCR